MRKILSLIIMALVLSSCRYKEKVSGTDNKKVFNDCLPDSLSALVKGKKLLIEKFRNIDSAGHTFRAVLTDDSLWHIFASPIVFIPKQFEDTLGIIHRSNEMVLINKHNCDVIGFYIAR
jgi:hypothetical protein